MFFLPSCGSPDCGVATLFSVSTSALKHKEKENLKLLTHLTTPFPQNNYKTDYKYNNKILKIGEFETANANYKTPQNTNDKKEKGPTETAEVDTLKSVATPQSGEPQEGRKNMPSYRKGNNDCFDFLQLLVKSRQ
jgi:hypothetical protein